MDILFFIVSNIFFGILCTIPTIVIEHVLAKEGVVRKKDPFLLIAGITIGIIVGRLWFPEGSLGLLLLIFAFLFPIGAYRHDLWTYLKKGKFPEDE